MTSFFPRRSRRARLAGMVLLLAAAALLDAAAARAQAATSAVERARTLLNQGKAREALPVLQGAVLSAPDDLDLGCDLARALAWSGRYADADGEYARVLAKNPKHREALLGLLRLRGYQGRPQDALALARQGLQDYPQDPEFLQEAARLQALIRRADCEKPRRFTARTGYYHEDYNFIGPGNGTELSLEDRQFHGWNVLGGATYQHRYGLDDTDFGVEADHKLGGHGAWAGFAAGGATSGTILPSARGALRGGLALGAGFSAEGAATYQHYDAADVYGLAPTLTWEGLGLAASVGYSTTQSAFTSGGASGWLGAYTTRLAWERWCRFKPWISYTHANEAFQPGLSLPPGDFRSDSYGGGFSLRVTPAVELSPYYTYESRPTLAQRVRYVGAGMSYSWGEMK